MEQKLSAKERISNGVQTFSKSIVQPVVFLGVTGTVIALFVILKLDVMPTAIKNLGNYIYQVFNNSVMQQLSILFCIGITTTMARKKKADAAVCSLLCFLIFLQSNNLFLAAVGKLIKAKSLSGTGQAMVLGTQVVDMGVFCGILVGFLVGCIFNRLCDVKFPDAVSFYGGTRLAFLAGAAATIVLAIIMAYVWPWINSLITCTAGFIANSGALGEFIYGFLCRFLIPTGLHHLITIPAMFSAAGGTATIAGQHVEGALTIWYAQLGNLSSIEALDPSVRYLFFGFSKMAGCIGICLAFIKTAKPEKKVATKGMLLPALFVALIAGITEPFEFSFLFISPLLWTVHSVFDGLFQTLAYVLGCRCEQALGILDFVTMNMAVPVQMTKIWIYIILQIIGGFVWYFTFVFLIKKFNIKTPGREDEKEIVFNVGREEAKKYAETQSQAQEKGNINDIIAGLGGKDNIKSVNNCFTRLRVEVIDMTKINEDRINLYPNSGLVKKASTVQIILGMKVQDVKEDVCKILGLD